MREETEAESRPADELIPRKKRPAITVFLIAVGLLLADLCYQIIQPFLTAIAWATILAVVFGPLSDRLSRVLKRENLSAFVSTAITMVVVILPLCRAWRSPGKRAKATSSFPSASAAGADGRDQSRVLGPVWHWTITCGPGQ